MSEASSETFTPLCPDSPGPAERGGYPVTILRGPPTVQSFQPLGQPVASVPPLVAVPHTHDPQITLHRDGERVTGIHIQCGCGRAIELGLEY